MFIMIISPTLVRGYFRDGNKKKGEGIQIIKIIVISV